MTETEKVNASALVNGLKVNFNVLNCTFDMKSLQLKSRGHACTSDIFQKVHQIHSALHISLYAIDYKLMPSEINYCSTETSESPAVYELEFKQDFMISSLAKMGRLRSGYGVEVLFRELGLGRFSNSIAQSGFNMCHETTEKQAIGVEPYSEVYTMPKHTLAPKRQAI